MGGSPPSIPQCGLESFTHCAEQRAAHFGSTVSCITFLSSARSASVDLTSTILPLTGCLHAAAPVLQS